MTGNRELGCAAGAFGPKPRKYTVGVNKKAMAGALRSALSLRAQAGDLLVVKEFTGEEIKTSGLGLPTDFATNIITQVGNYGEIYERNLGPDTPFDLPRNGPNRQWDQGGLLYAPPFR